ncbi:MAG: DnaJ domain-containing protein [Gammaproteobacteria bacterium]|nr:DnaJ domain-containing protein [Gammaproteobacteria bacterium]MDH3377317.1 DnaJ domain-containing protein [Gammaproteobacteria bacterium]
MKFKDYYEVMGVNRDATQDEIKRAYRKLARKYHPDVSKQADAEERFKEVGEAYEVLKDPEKRAAYDQLGANWKAGQDFQAPPDWDAGFEFTGGGYTGGFGDDAGAHSDFFESLFGQGFRGAGPAGPGSRGGFHVGGTDHHAKVLIDLDDAMNGATRSISLRVPEVDARGHVTTRERVLKVNIPKGVKQGQHIRLAGQGNRGIGEGKPGDLYLEIEFNPHSIYRVEGRDVYLDLPVAPWEAALGASIKVPTPAGPVDMKIKPQSANGSKLRLSGRGIPGKPPGDLYVTLQIALPPATTDKAKEIYRDMRQALDFNPRARLGV